MQRKSFNLNTMVLSFVASICVILLTGCGQENTYHTTDVSLYLQMEGNIANEGEDVRSGFFVFPESIEEFSNVEYEYYCEEGVLDNSYMIFLKATYPDEKSYNEEEERLSNITCEVKTSKGTVVNEIEYTETLFEYPAYVTVYNTNMSFEYALTDEENYSVVYVYLKLCEGSDFLPDKYLPKEFVESSMMNYDTSWKNQNIYYAPDGDGVHVYFQDEID